MLGAPVMRVPGSLSATVFAFLGSSASLGCGTGGDIVVAEVAAPAATGKPCTSSTECPEEQYCDMPSCDADGGTCLLVPSSTDCPDAPDLVCGCSNGVFYWNKCVRQQNGISASRDCKTATNVSTCGDGTPCPEGFCSEGPQPCDPKTPSLGTCWVVPATCPSDDTGVFFSSCDSSEKCISSCEAIRSQKPFDAVQPALCE
jgi:hypothetical protein